MSIINPTTLPFTAVELPNKGQTILSSLPYLGGQIIH